MNVRECTTMRMSSRSNIATVNSLVELALAELHSGPNCTPLDMITVVMNEIEKIISYNDRCSPEYLHSRASKPV